MRTIPYSLFILRSANLRSFPPNKIAVLLSILRSLEGLLELFLALKPSGTCAAQHRQATLTDTNAEFAKL
jgi:hypothetical protein